MLIIVILNTIIIIHSEENSLLLCINLEVFLQSVEPKIEGDQLDNMLANMTSGENSQLSNLVNVGDSQAALRMVGAINSLLNAQSTKTPSGNDSEREGARKEKRKEVNCLKMIKFVARLVQRKIRVPLNCTAIGYCTTEQQRTCWQGKAFTRLKCKRSKVNIYFISRLRRQRRGLDI